MIAFRNCNYWTPVRGDTQPQRRPGRYHRGVEDEPTQYLCLHPLGPHAEALRRADFRTPHEARTLDLRTWALEVDTTGFVTVDFDERRVADDWGACQDLGDVLRESGVRGAIVPSAALPGTKNLVLFGARKAFGFLAPGLRPIDVRASITGEHSCALETLVSLVRFKGESHPGAGFQFVEPDWAYA